MRNGGYDYQEGGYAQRLFRNKFLKILLSLSLKISQHLKFYSNAITLAKTYQNHSPTILTRSILSRPQRIE